MAKREFLTPYQKGKIRRYYEHKDDITHQKLSEIVSELYVCTDDRKAARLWKSVQTALVNCGVHAARAERMAAARDLEKLAQIVSEIF